MFLKLYKVSVTNFIPVPGPGPETSLCYCYGLSLPSRSNSPFLLTIPKQDKESVFVPSLDWLCKAGATSWSGVPQYIQDYCPKPCSCES